MVAETAVGNEGEEEISLYQVRTKSRTIIINISFNAAETIGDSGTSGGKDWGDLCSHWERMVTACQAAGVEKAKGRAAFERGFGT